MNPVGWSPWADRPGREGGRSAPPNRLILSAAVVIRSGERHARHERSPVIAGSSPRISCRIPPTGAASLGPDRSMSSRSHARRIPVVHTVISPEGGGHADLDGPGLCIDRSDRSPLTSDGPDLYLRRTWHVPRRSMQATAGGQVSGPPAQSRARGQCRRPTPWATETSTAPA